MHKLKNIFTLLLSILLGAKAFSQEINKEISTMEYQNLIQCINNTDITTIRQGEKHKFIDMWMVVVDDRIFARSWRGAKNGWYYKFLKDSKGAIQCGDKFYEIEGIVPNDLDELNQKINEAYTQKYGNGEYPKIAKEMIEPERMNRTLELIIKIKQ